jgi:hypothetical protein
MLTLVAALLLLLLIFLVDVRHSAERLELLRRQGAIERELGARDELLEQLRDLDQVIRTEIKDAGDGATLAGELERIVRDRYTVKLRDIIERAGGW